jgi:hypothetical protein
MVSGVEQFADLVLDHDLLQAQVRGRRLGEDVLGDVDDARVVQEVLRKQVAAMVAGVHSRPVDAADVGLRSTWVPARQEGFRALSPAEAVNLVLRSPARVGRA